MTIEQLRHDLLKLRRPISGAKRRDLGQLATFTRQAFDHAKANKAEIGAEDMRHMAAEIEMIEKALR